MLRAVICFIICRRLCNLFKDIICLQCVTTLIVHFSFTPRINITDSIARRTSSSYAATHCLRSQATRLRKSLIMASAKPTNCVYSPELY